MSSVQFSCSVLSDSLRPHEPQHTRPPCPSPTPGVHPNPCPLSRWCLPTISPLSSPSRALNLSQHQGLFKWVSSSHQVAKVLEFQLQTSVLPMNTQDSSPLGWTGWISLQSRELSRVFSSTTVLTFRSLIHFEFVFVYGVRKCSSFILLQVVDQFSQHYLLEIVVFSIIYSSLLCQR